MFAEPKILIVDLGSQLTLLIARALRECGYRSVVLSPKKAGEWAKLHMPQAVIFSGSDKSVHDSDAPAPPASLLGLGLPMLGICYGMQWYAKYLGGTVARDHANVEYGPADTTLLGGTLFSGIAQEQSVWASHGDSVTSVPADIEVIATGSGGGIRAMYVPEHRFWGVQFHPEVSHTPCGKQVLTNFVRDICGCEPDWEPADIVASIRSEITEDTSIRAVLGFSGGVDSTTMAAIIAPAMGDRLLGICIDSGQFREGELEEIRRHAASAGIALKVVDAKKLFVSDTPRWRAWLKRKTTQVLECLGTKIYFTGALDWVTDAEEKRRIFKRVYLHILKFAAADFRATHVVQGTLAPDEIESGVTGGALIKSHHNVGHDWGNLGELKPLSMFFKYEVRALAAELGLPDSVVNREPFPGPGLFIRILGPVTEKRLDTLRWADYQVDGILAVSDEVPEISQRVVALCCVNTTGVKGDGRAYGPAAIVRAVQTSDFMTASAVEFPVSIRRAIIATLTRDERIVRVWWDEVPKPPATTEFE